MPKTWFLAPDFSFRPDGEIRLGMVLKYPDRPTLALASICPEETPGIPLPEVTSFTETSHAHSTGSNNALRTKAFIDLTKLVSASRDTDVSREKLREFSTVDHTVSTFLRAPSQKALQEITQLETVKKYINGGPFGRFRKRPVYLLTGLHIAKDSFIVTENTGSLNSLAGNTSVPSVALGSPIPLGVGGTISTRNQKNDIGIFKTAPGVVFAYRLHVIRAKSDGSTESELLSEHRAAFYSGVRNSENDEEESETDFIEVSTDMVKEERCVKSTMREHRAGEDTLVVFSCK